MIDDRHSARETKEGGGPGWEECRKWRKRDVSIAEELFIFYTMSTNRNVQCMEKRPGDGSDREAIYGRRWATRGDEGQQMRGERRETVDKRNVRYRDGGKVSKSEIIGRCSTLSPAECRERKSVDCCDCS